MKNSPRFSKLRVESLEERTLLAVMAGGLEQAVTLPAPTESTTWWVATAEDTFEDDVLSLRDAFARAQSGDTVRFVPELSGGTITMSEMSLTIPYFAVQKGVTVDASDLPGGITIDANGISRVFYVYGGTDSEPTVLKGLTITGGSIANDGGGIYVAPGTVTLEGCTVTGNHLSGLRSLGAGICNRGTLTVTNCIVSGNTTEGYGGGIFNSGTLTVTDTVISGNQNCGIYQNQGTVTVTDSIIVGNSADTGGGIYHSSGTLTLANCTVSGNSAVRYGGGIFTLFLSPSDISICNSVIAGNTAGNDGNEIYKNSLSAVICACNTLSSYTDWTEPENCLEYDPNLPLFTDAENGDYTLAAGSQAINAGNNDFVTAETDLAGNPRIMGGIVDLGAYECQTEAPSTVVTTHNDVIDETDGLISLREAVLYAESGQTVTFDASLAGKAILLEKGEIRIDKSITIDAGGIGGIQIDTGWTSRIFYISGGERESPVHLVALTVTGGFSDGGSAIYNTGALVLTDCVLADNIAEGICPCGGAVSNAGDLTMTGCTLSENSAVAENFYSSYGGAIYNSASLSLDHCILSGNAASYGGGIYNNEGTITVQKTSFSGNIADSSGGGINNFEGALTVIGSLFNENRGETNGGGIDNAGNAVLTNCSLFGNHAYNGGGLYNESVSSLTLTGCTVVKNTAVYGGGGIYSYYLYLPGNVTLENSIVLLNTAPYFGADIYNTAGIKGVHSLSTFTDWNESSGTLVYDPSKPLFVNAAGGDCTLAENSQAINKGSNDYVTTETDLAGNSRIVNGIVDIGAYEYQGTIIEQLVAPTITTGNRGVYVSAGANRHQIIWDDVENASGYELAYSADGNSWTTISANDPVAVVIGLTYGQDVKYRVRALGNGGSYTDSDWSAVKTFNVCPMDIDGDDFIGPGDNAILSAAWFLTEEDASWEEWCDIDGDGFICPGDYSYLSSNWFLETGDANLDYPTPKAADIVFTEYQSADLNTDLSVF